MRLLPDSPRSQRFLAVVLLLIAILLAYLLFVHWWLVSPYLAMRDEYYDLKDQQYRLAELIQSKPVIEKQLKDIAGLEQENQAFLNDADPTSAFSDLSERLKQAVAQNLGSDARCTVNSVAPSPSHASEVYLRVSASITMSCQAETFAKVLYMLESSNPYLFVDKLVIYRQPPAPAPTPAPSKPVSKGAATAAATTATATTTATTALINAQFMLSGFLRQPGGAKEGK
jgi:general secretion pathway protein M